MSENGSSQAVNCMHITVHTTLKSKQ